MKQTGLSERGRLCQAPPIAWLMHKALERPQIISLAAGFTDNETLPVREVVSLVREVMKTPGEARQALQYGYTAGHPGLRQLTLERLLSADAAALKQSPSPLAGGPAAHAVADRMLITNGSQQLLYLMSEALCDKGDIVLVEDPTYFVFLGILQSHGLRSRTVRMTPTGIDLEHLERVLEDLRQKGDLPHLKFLYLVTYFQNPTGLTTSYETKAGALRLLRKYERWAGHPIYLLEDAAYRELRIEGDDVPSALTLKGLNERVIYTGTYSKPFATGVKVGYSVLPEPLFTVANRIKGNHDFGTSSLLQHLLWHALTSCRYERHVAVLRRRYKIKADAMLSAIREHFPSRMTWTEPRGGLYVWASAPRPFTTGAKSALFQEALKKDVLFVPGEFCYADDPTRRKPASGMRLSFGNASEEQIHEGIQRLGAVLHRFLDRK